MDFSPSAKVEQLQTSLLEFMERFVYPAESVYWEQINAAGDPHKPTQVMEELKAEARSRGLWNLFMRDPRYGPGLTNLEYAPLAEISGRSLIAPEALNCAAPDTGNMEVLAEFGTDEQKELWLSPLLEGSIRSCFAMTEPDVASSDATNLRSTITKGGDGYIINGRKWWTSGAADPRCKLILFLGLSHPENDRYMQHSLVLVPMDTPGVRVIRTLPVFGFDYGHGHCEIQFEDVRVPSENLVGGEGAGFVIGQARLGPGRVHHCMRAIGMAERALELMCRRADSREAFGKMISEQGVVREWIADSRMRIDQARLLVLRAAWEIDREGPAAARSAISAIKVVAADVATWVVDRAIQVHGGGGVSNDFPLALMYACARTLHIVDGPDEVHRMVIAREELKRHRE